MSTTNGKQTSPPGGTRDRSANGGRPHLAAETVHRRTSDGQRVRIYPPIMLAEEHVNAKPNAVRGVVIAVGIILSVIGVVALLLWLLFGGGR
jgi:hypothetical protein